jgi:DNA-binding CsgD family transcriptional regulator
MKARMRGAGLFGRDHELARIRPLLQRTGRGTGCVIAIEGPPGIGKSRLLTEASGEARELGFEVLPAAAHALERDRPFGPLIEVFDLVPVDPAVRTLRGLLRIDARAGEPLRYRLIDAFEEAIESMTSRGPTLVTIDDVHWADPATLLVASRLARIASTLPLALIVAMRPLPRSPELTALLEQLVARGATTLTLGPLDDGSVLRLAHDVLGAEPGPRLRAKLNAVAGNPLYATELLSALEHDEAIALSSGFADTSDDGVPPSLRAAILRQLEMLDPADVATLRAAAVLGSPFSLNDLSVVTATSAFELHRQLDEPISLGLVCEEGDKLSFRHEVVRDAIYEDLAVSTRRALHLQFARSLAGAGAAASQIAAHVVESAVERDPVAAEWLRRAASETVPRDPSAAADLLRHALALAGPGDADRAAALSELTRTLALSGRFAEALDVGRTALGAQDHRTRGERVLWLSRVLRQHGSHADALELIEDAELDRTALPDELLARVDAEVADLCLVLGKVDRAVERAAEAFRLARDDATVASALAVQARLAALRGDSEEAERVVVASVAALRRSADGERYTFLGEAALVHFFLGNLRQAWDLLAETVRRQEEIGVPWLLPNHHSLMCLVAFADGRWDDALAEHEATLMSAEDIERPFYSLLTWGTAAEIAARRNEPRRAADLIARGTALFERAQWRGQYSFDHARAVVAEVAGDPDEALRIMSHVAFTALEAGDVFIFSAAAPDAVKLAVTLDDAVTASSLVRSAEELLSRANGDRFAAAALRCRGLVDRDSEQLTRALALYASRGYSGERWSTTEDIGVCMQTQGIADGAVPFLEQALDAYNSVGAVWDCARIEARLRSVGVRKGSKASRRRPSHGPESLTEAERKILGLVRAGLPNGEIARRLYVSKRTVESHISRLFRKLGVSSRAELVALAARMDES